MLGSMHDMPKRESWQVPCGDDRASDVDISSLLCIVHRKNQGVHAYGGRDHTRARFHRDESNMDVTLLIPLSVCFVATVVAIGKQRKPEMYSMCLLLAC